MVDRGTFIRQVHELFDRLDDRPFLASHPLGKLLSTKQSGISPESLRRVLLGVIDELRPPDGTPPGSTNWRRWRCLTLRYVDGANTKQVARELRVSDRQALRDHLLGINAVAEVLWARFGQPEQPSPPVVAEPERSTDETRPTNLDVQESLETELARAAAMPHGGTTEVAEALESAVVTIQKLAEEQQARFEISLPQDLRPVTVNPMVLRQAFLCLLTASVMQGTAPHITLEATNAADCVYVVFSVRTSSAPLPVEGLGNDDEGSLIVTARRLVQPEGGDLGEENRGNGSRSLLLTLPTAPTLTLLVIDDNPDVAELFRWYLAGRNYYVVQARTPPTALELARSLQPDVIVLDILMPAQDGWQILEQLRFDPASRNIPVIVCSFLPERQIAQSFGVADFLPKPITQQHLLAALGRCLGAKASAAYQGLP